jgi:hypothetical protein
MTRIHHLQVSMTRGAVTPLVHSRVEIEDYKVGLVDATNWMVLKYGGLTRFPGTTWLGSLLSGTPSTYNARLLPFIFSEDEAYVFCFSDEELRIFDATIGEWVESSPGTTLVVTSPYDAADIDRLQIESIGDVSYLSCPGYEPKQVIRYSGTDFQFVDYDTDGGPWLPLAAPGSATLQIDGEANALPAKTDLTTPSGTVSTTGSVTNAWKVFDQNRTDAATTSEKEVDITYDLGVGEGFAVTGYAMTAIKDRQFAFKTPVSWKLFGKTDGGTIWELLDEHSLTSDWQTGETRLFEVANTKVYRQYRFVFDCTDGAGDTTDNESYLPTINMLAAVSDQAAITLNASSIIGINNDTGFKSTDVGRKIRFMADDGFWRELIIDSVTSTTSVEVKVIAPAPIPELFNSEDAGTTIWHLQAWGDDVGYPRAVTRHMGRLGFLGTPTQPRSGWLSRSADFDSFATSQPLVADDAVDFTLVNGRQDEILWGTSNGSDLLVGTVGGIRVLTKRDPSEVFGPDNVEEAGATTTRASWVLPVWINKIMVFVDKYRTRLHETAFSTEAGGYDTAELTMLNEHLFRQGIKEIHYQIAPANIIWCVMDDGALVACTYDRQQRVFGATPIVLPTDSNVTEAKILSVCSVPAGTGDSVFFAIERTVGGTKQITLEALNPLLLTEAEAGTAGSESDACLAGSVVFGTSGGASLTTVTIPDHLVNSVVTIYDLENDEILGTTTPVSTTLDIGAVGTASWVQVGVPYASRMEMLRPPNMPEDGGLLGRQMIPVEIWVDMLESRGLRAGGPKHTEPLRPEGDAETNPDVPMKYTGRLQVFMDEEQNVEGAGVVVETDTPYPATIRGIMATFDRGG